MNPRTIIRFFNQRLHLFLQSLKIPTKVAITYSSHSLRINFINVLKNAGIDDRIIQKKVGHKNLATTSIYYRSDASTAKLVGDAINKQFKE